MAFVATSNIRFKEKMYYEKLSDVVTIAEEAFAILIIENSFHTWKYCTNVDLKKKYGTSEAEVADRRRDDDYSYSSIYTNTEERIPKVPYQKNYKFKKRNRETAGKWNEKGMIRFNELCELVKQSRNSNWRELFEKDIQERYVNNADEKLNSYNKRLRRQENKVKQKKPKVHACNMFDPMSL